ncbi:hypothetical protein L9F63_008818, partial [Diploptera punctata]
LYFLTMLVTFQGKLYSKFLNHRSCLIKFFHQTKSIHAVIIVKLPDKTCLYTQTKITEVNLSLRILAHQYCLLFQYSNFLS